MNETIIAPTAGVPLPTRELPQPMKPPLPTSPLPVPAELKPRPIAEKVVTLSSTNGVWEVDIKLSGPKVIFSERDINMLIRFLQVRKAHFRRQAAIASWKSSQSSLTVVK